MAFAMVSVKEPRSVNAEGKERYKQELHDEATTWLQDGQMLEGDLYIRIIWFHSIKFPGDANNITKPICDALQGVVYEDDKIVVKFFSERINYTRSNYILRANDPHKGSAYRKLDTLLGGNHRHIVYIEVDLIKTKPERQIIFGPIDKE